MSTWKNEVRDERDVLHATIAHLTKVVDTLTRLNQQLSEQNERYMGYVYSKMNEEMLTSPPPSAPLPPGLTEAQILAECQRRERMQQEERQNAAHLEERAVSAGI